MSASADSSVLAVGVDDGYAVTKLALSTGQLVAIPSRGRLRQAAVTAVNGKASGVSEYRTDGDTVSVGGREGDATASDDYPFSSLNRAIVQHALLEAGLSGRSLHAVSGLPVARFYRPDGGRREDLIARKRVSLQQAVHPLDGRAPASVARHDVIPEALAAWYDHVIVEGDDGPSLDDQRLKTPLAIVDIGGRTTDFVLVADEKLWHESSGSLTCGLLDLREDIARAVCEAFDLEQLSETAVDRALEQGRVRLFGKDHDVADIVRDARRQLVSRVEQETRRRLGRGAELERVLFVGGGSVALAEALRDWFANQEIAPHAGFANARGMLKYQRYVGID
jgi:plasmid segregation protein ParM